MLKRLVSGGINNNQFVKRKVLSEKKNPIIIYNNNKYNLFKAFHTNISNKTNEETTTNNNAEKETIDNSFMKTKKPVNRFSSQLFPLIKKSMVSSESAPGLADELQGTIESHAFLTYSGYIKQISSGVFTYLPVANRIMEKLIKIIDKSLQNINCQKLTMPSLLPKEMWEETGRWTTSGPELVKLRDRKNREYCLAPTHEECISTIFKSTVFSYKNLPVRLYQIGTKYRDEARPRYGLLRAKEFVMKDLYSFDNSKEATLKTYFEVVEAYKAIFDSLNLNYAMVEADSGNIGGELSHEFQVVSEVGEDHICHCNCEVKYCANVEKGVGFPSTIYEANKDSLDKLTKVETMNIDDNSVGEKLDLIFNQLNDKVQIFVAATKPKKHVLRSTVGYSKIFIIVRKEDSFNEVKLNNILERVSGVDVEVTLLGNWENQKQILGTKSVTSNILVVDSSAIDNDLSSILFDESGMNTTNTPNSAKVVKAMIRNVSNGDICGHSNPNCKRSELSCKKGIEVGHVFYLGQKYSEPMNIKIMDEKSKKIIPYMGCYGIGVSRLFQVLAEVNRTKEGGITWPMAVAPFRAVIVPLIPNASMLAHLPQEEQEAKKNLIMETSEEIYHKINSIEAFRNEVLLDDRIKERAFSKMLDLGRVGTPYAVELNAKTFLENGLVTVHDRVSGTVQEMSVEDCYKFFKIASDNYFERMSKFNL
ncbi:hypothetical protein ABK040_008738 [Willaertia magna]